MHGASFCKEIMFLVNFKLIESLKSQFVAKVETVE